MTLSTDHRRRTATGQQIQTRRKTIAIYRLSAQVISRSAGRSATAAAAYRAGVRLEDRRTGQLHDYERRSGVVHAEIVAPEQTPAWMLDRTALWNAVEIVEKRKDAQLSREVQLALPHELNAAERLSLVRDYVVALDIKGELVDTTIASRTAKGQRVVALDPFRTSKASRVEGQKPVGFNPMAFIRSAHRSRDAAVLADGIIVPETGNGAHFSDRARACLQTTIEVVHELSEAPTLHEVRGFILSAGFLDTLAAWAETPELAGGRAAELAGSFPSMGDKERGSILSTVAKSLEWTSADAMRGFLGVKIGINLESLLLGDTDLFIVIPLDQVTAQAGFMRLMANLLLAVMVQQNERQPARKQVLFVADEFTRLGRLDRIVDIATVAAGINLETLFILQDKGSLEAVYGNQAADTIIGSCATVRIFNLGRGDSRTAEWASKLAGYQTLRTQSTSATTGSKTAGTSSAEVREPLLTAADILELPTSEMLCFIRGRKPLRMQRILWYKLRRYRGD